MERSGLAALALAACAAACHAPAENANKTGGAAAGPAAAAKPFDRDPRFSPGRILEADRFLASVLHTPTR